MSEWQGLAAAYALGAIGYALGLWLSVPLDLSSGPLVVCTLAALVIAMVVVRRNGAWMAQDESDIGSAGWR